MEIQQTMFTYAFQQLRMNRQLIEIVRKCFKTQVDRDNNSLLRFSDKNREGKPCFSKSDLSAALKPLNSADQHKGIGPG